MTSNELGFPTRLHGLLARSGSEAVVLRHGPSKHVCTVDWNRTRNVRGSQWLPGGASRIESESGDGTMCGLRAFRWR